MDIFRAIQSHSQPNPGACHVMSDGAHTRLRNPLSKSNEILTANTSWNRVQTLQILW